MRGEQKLEGFWMFLPLQFTYEFPRNTHAAAAPIRLAARIGARDFSGSAV
jgi:hypothetical protein